MCGLFGFLTYAKQEKNNLKGNPYSELLKYLGQVSTIRGTQATGIAYNAKGELKIKKDSVSAQRFEFALLKPVRAAIGHTRRTTKGSAFVNNNNHPFLGEVSETEFAFAHNGVIDNDTELRRKLNLRTPTIQTDSYVAVQMIEKYNSLEPTALQKMAEQIIGSFTFTILDRKNNIYFVKNDSPLHMVHFKKLKLYVYASTREILMEALNKFNLTADVLEDVLKGKVNAKDEIEYIEMTPGEIWVLNRYGKCNKVIEFEPNDRFLSTAGYYARQRALYGDGNGDEYYEGLWW